ncbi:MAG: L-aspartate oxidase [Verrucomicrobiota bacterium]
MKTFDVIVVGSGIAGLSFALGMGRLGYRVAIITKKDRAESNTNYAQGGIASVTSQKDDFELHVKDTITAGDGLCNEDVVREIISAGPDRINELIELGVAFTHLGDGRVSLHKEGGHSKRRILHVKDLTGAAIEAAMLDAVAACKTIEVFEHYMAIDLITFEKLRRKGMSLGPMQNQVVGLYALDSLNGKVEAFSSRVVMMATGGVGQVYQYSTNPTIATGDGIAMAFRAGAEVRNMEFIQFHPTSLFTYTNERFLISEAVRGEGAILRNLKRQPFMERYDDRKELAPRDIVARAIDSEMKKSGAQHLWLDITEQSEASVRDRFPNIFEALQKQGVNMANDPIPVVPACHYLCGGVTTDLAAQTSLPGLLACGEVACTGLHGANRLASNSLLEACVLARAGVDTATRILQQTPVSCPSLPDWVDGDMRDPDERVVLSHNLDELKRTMWDYVGIVRTTKRLRRAKTRVNNLQTEINEYYWNFKVEPDLLELRNLIQVAELIIDCALQRRESRGLHFTLDFPDQLAEPEDSIVNHHASMHDHRIHAQL